MRDGIGNSYECHGRYRKSSQAWNSFRSGAGLQKLDQVKTVAMDKTGTLTQGMPQVIRTVTPSNEPTNRLLEVAAAVQSHSEHPIARAILRYAKEQSITAPAMEQFQVIQGMGVQGRLESGSQIMAGNLRWMNQLGVSTSNVELSRFDLRSENPVYVACDGKLLGVISVADAIKPSALETVTALKQTGRSIWMLTGDRQSIAESVGNSLGIDQIRAELFPEQKREEIQKLQQSGQRVAFVGDGINDGPSLAQSDVGIAMGTGTDLAIESADIVLTSGDLRKLIRAVRISHLTIQNIRMNLAWAFGYNVLLIPVAAGAFYPFFRLSLSPVVAAAAMSLSSIFVVLNSLRLRNAG